MFRMIESQIDHPTKTYNYGLLRFQTWGTFPKNWRLQKADFVSVP